MAAVTSTGTLTRATPKRMTDPDYLGMRKYSPNTERYLHYLDCCLTTADGSRYFFSSPKVSQTVTSAGGAAVCLYHVEGSAAEWFEAIDGSGVATAEYANTNGIRPRVLEGDAVTVRASVKAVKPTYVSLNRVKLVAAAVA